MGPKDPTRSKAFPVTRAALKAMALGIVLLVLLACFYVMTAPGKILSSALVHVLLLLGVVLIVALLFIPLLRQVQKEAKNNIKPLTTFKEEYRNLLGDINDGYFLIQDEKIVIANDRVAEVMGIPMERIVGKTLSEAFPSSDALQQVQERLFRRTKGILQAERYEITSSTGRSFEISAKPIQYEGKPAVSAVVREITERKRAEQEVRIRDKAMSSSINAIAMADLGGNLTYVNSSFLKLWGYDDAQDIMGRPAVAFWEATDQAAEIMAALFENGGWEGELVAKRRDGSLFDVQLSATMVKDEEGKPICMMASFMDITDRKRMEETIRYLAYHDSVTGLPNRVLFNDRLGLALARSHRNREHLALISLDLDHFKNVNDTFGHGVGDQLLKAVGERLATLLRNSDTASRIGGDEFVVLLPDITKAEEAAVVAGRILQAIREPFAIEGHQVRITTSIGIATHPQDAGDGHELMKHADLALYRAKQEGRDNWRCFSRELAKHYQSTNSKAKDRTH